MIVTCECSIAIDQTTHAAVVRYCFRVRTTGESDTCYERWQEAAEAADRLAFAHRSRAIYLDRKTSIVFASHRK